MIDLRPIGKGTAGALSLRVADAKLQPHLREILAFGRKIGTRQRVGGHPGAGDRELDPVLVRTQAQAWKFDGVAAAQEDGQAQQHGAAQGRARGVPRQA